MKNHEILEKILPGVKPYSKEYQLIKKTVESWGNWKAKDRGGSFKKGHDPRRGGV